jgi:hypothetical protein
MRPSYVWEELFHAAMVGTDLKAMPNRIQAAKFAIDTRLHEMQRGQGDASDERQAITDALRGLNILRRELEERRGSARP